MSTILRINIFAGILPLCPNKIEIVAFCRTDSGEIENYDQRNEDRVGLPQPG